ncbi:MAG: ABC transporter ATP-binding protein [Acidimicrobiales bacterium]
MSGDRRTPSTPEPGDAAGAVALSNLTVHWPAADEPHRAMAVLDGLGLSVAAGSFLAVVGPSGCGKSTILRVLAGLLVPDTGRATVGGVDVVGRPGRCAWLPQRDDLLPWRRVLDNATLGAELGGRPRRQAQTEARVLLDRFGLGGLERAWPAQLSGGMRQRLAVLRTFLVDAPVLLLDEPFGALDALTRRRMQAWLQEVWLADNGPAGASPSAGQPTTTPPAADRRTVVLVTHDVEEALLLADRVVVLSEHPGRIVADVAMTFARPRPPSLVTDPTFVAERARLLAALGV